jgi:hypothetical protein
LCHAGVNFQYVGIKYGINENKFKVGYGINIFATTATTTATTSNNNNNNNNNNIKNKIFFLISAMEKEKRRQLTMKHYLILSLISKQNVLSSSGTLHWNVYIYV